MNAACFDFADHVRQSLVLVLCNLLQPTPKRIFETDARLCPSMTMDRLVMVDFMSVPSDRFSQPNWLIGTRIIYCVATQ